MFIVFKRGSRSVVDNYVQGNREMNSISNLYNMVLCNM